MSLAPERSLGFAGASNFRDLGGYAGAGGLPVRWRRLFRSDHLAGLTPKDAQQFQRLGVTRVFDFRGEQERAAVPYDLPGVTQHALTIEPTVVQRMKDLLDAGEAITPERTVALMQQTYRGFVHDNADRFAELFAHLLADDAPAVVHCTAGKDRTGFAVALLLRVLAGAAVARTPAMLVGVGFCGAYTTFSTWMWESLLLAEDRRMGAAALNVAGQLVLGLAAAAAGWAIGAAP